MDIDHIDPGEDFNEVIQKTLNTVQIAIVLIGKNWLEMTDATGERRLDNPDDLVRLEIAAVLERKIRAIPVLVGGAVVPRSSPKLQEIKRFQAFQILAVIIVSPSIHIL